MSENKRILFVDDDPGILDGMKRMLRSIRREYDFYFANSGKEALNLMAESDCDIIISDMRMPGMNGAELLAAIKEKYPDTIRLILTGQADDESVLRTIGVTHQFLTKPCESKKLKLVISTVSTLHDLLCDSQLKSIISSIDSLPSLPVTYAKIQEMATDPESSIGDIAALIEEDLAMSAKVLQLVNSAFFGLYQKISSPSRAVSLLGLDTIKSLVLGVQIFSELKEENKLLPISKLFSHSVSVGALAQKIAIAAEADKQVTDDCLIAGILHDVGKLLLLSKIPDRYNQVLEAAGPDLNLHEAERQILHADHGLVGAYLIGLWGLPGSVVEAICFHHRLDKYPADSFNPALAVHLADALCHELQPGQSVGALPVINGKAVATVGLTDRIEEFKTIAMEVLSD